MTCEEIDEMVDGITSCVKKMSRQSLEDLVYCARDDEWEGGGKKYVKELMKELDEDERYVL